MRKLLVYGLIVAGILVIVHHWYVKGSPVDLSNLLSHEFFAGLLLSLGLGALIL